MHSIRYNFINPQRIARAPRSINSRLAVVALFGAATVGSVAAMAAPPQTAPQTGWYGNLNAGRSSIDNADTDSVFANQGVASQSSVDKHDTVYSLGIGYQFSPNFALEGGYTDFGKFDLHSAIFAPAADTAHGQYKIDGWNLTGVGIIPLNNGFSVYGKAGVFYSDVKLDASSDTGATPVSGHDKRSTNGTWGLGVGYDFGNHVIGKLEWNRYQNLGDSGSTGELDLDTYTVGVSYRFY